MFEVMNAGLETAIQDYPGRVGYWNQGFPPSGPMDHWSFRLANVLVGNEPGDAALECQFTGPELRFHEDTVVAVTGGDMQPHIDGEPIELWRSYAVKAGQTLKLSYAKTGARGYIAVAGAIRTEPWLGSRATFHKAGVGGFEGRAIQAGQQIPTGDASGGTPDMVVIPEARPELPSDKRWEIEVVAGPNDDWLDEAGVRTFLEADWKLSAKSDRTGYRLEGPGDRLTFADKAINKRPEHGSEPSNIIDQGYPNGAINLAGLTPIILVKDGPSMGGFINPFTVPTSGFWKLGQVRPGEVIRFRAISVDEAQRLAREMTRICSRESLRPA
ncbi:KipI antagonist [wastewater metagenome]|uniref:KipI antagonist n=2 Tax=unclassified sequences TaxID=12908 RepID=A0A5B8R821_9ZZZZ|nr:MULTISPECIES: biotin-dependent carboxyltransferase family protein [Arhodomonas]MCS4504930.1 biotin-dependent carboxyltransferase family protein [Arhodomonas aquaeolei]QEA04118.1 KipI antagonist [uncultured organism]